MTNDAYRYVKHRPINEGECDILEVVAILDVSTNIASRPLNRLVDSGMVVKLEQVISAIYEKDQRR